MTLERKIVSAIGLVLALSFPSDVKDSNYTQEIYQKRQCIDWDIYEEPTEENDEIKYEEHKLPYRDDNPNIPMKEEDYFEDYRDGKGLA